jgi:pyruvate/2-oxoglutarate/acetoin dehydrogenase E1 component
MDAQNYRAKKNKTMTPKIMEKSEKKKGSNNIPIIMRVSLNGCSRIHEGHSKKKEKMWRSGCVRKCMLWLVVKRGV